MKIVVVGTGYVGLVTGTCLAESGNEVICVDIDRAKVEALRSGAVPIYEPGLAELVTRNVTADRLSFSTSLADSAEGAGIVFLAVGTPQGEQGAPDLTAIFDVVESLADVLEPEAIVVIKSTVPVGTNRRVWERLSKLTRREVDVASNPEFLKEGAAIDDFMRPDRVVIGVRRPEVGDALRALYSPFLRTEQPLLVMCPESAEMTKYVANALLATKISFINEVANLCEGMDADINDVRRGIGHDRRIGFAFLFPGVGYGGSCFPKDVRALVAMARQHGVEPELIEAVDRVNDRQKRILLSKIHHHFGSSVRDRKIAMWGVAFKPQTDDIREAPALAVIDDLLENGAQICVHDPEAMENVRRRYASRIEYGGNPLDVLKGADALVIMTEWKEFVHPDFDRMRSLMARPVIFDGRNLYEPGHMSSAGFEYHSIGRASVRPLTAPRD